MQVFWEINLYGPTTLTSSSCLVFNICLVAKTGFPSRKLPEDTSAAQLDGTRTAISAGLGQAKLASLWHVPFRSQEPALASTSVFELI